MSTEAAYPIDVRPLLDEHGVSIPIDAEVELPILEVGSETFTPLGPARLVATLTGAGAGIVLLGTLTVTVRAVCSRCLREFPLEVSTEIDGFYVQPGEESGLPEEQEFGFVVEGSVDVMEALLAALALDLPFAPVHAEDCPGICPVCGADLNEGPCGCAPTKVGSPFAALADLLPPEEGS